MKKLALSIIVLTLFASASFAVSYGFGARNIAMGGCGIATANDITAAYFNPAGLMYGPGIFEAQMFAGGTLAGISSLQDMLTSGDDFIKDNFDEDIDFPVSISGGLGLSFNKVGLSAFGLGNALINKPPANQQKFSTFALINGNVPLTLGSTFATPGLPIASLSVGVNLKAIMEQYISLSAAAGVGKKVEMSGSGFGFDIGVQTKITPLISLGAVIRNLSASTNRVTKSTDITVDTSGQITDGTETEKKSSYTPAPETGVGVGVVVPITGTLIACDLENYSYPDNNNVNKSTAFTDTHIGIEQGFFFNLVMLRLGYFSYGAGEDNFYTYGMGINAGPASINLAAANSQKDFQNSIAMTQIGIAF